MPRPDAPDRLAARRAAWDRIMRRLLVECLEDAEAAGTSGSSARKEANDRAGSALSPQA